MGFTVKHKKRGNMITRSFTYTGDLAKCIEDAEKELAKKRSSEEWTFLRWQADRAKAALAKYEGRMDDLSAFISAGMDRLRADQEIEKEDTPTDGQTSPD